MSGPGRFVFDTTPDPATGRFAFETPRDATTTPRTVVRNPLQDYDQTSGGPEKVRIAIAAAGTPKDAYDVASRMLPGRNVHMTKMGLAYTADDGTLTLLKPLTSARLGNPKAFAKKMLGENPMSGADMVESVPTLFNALAAVTAAGGPAGLPARALLAGSANLAGQQAAKLAQKGVDRAVNETAAPDSRTHAERLSGGAADFAVGAGGEVGAWAIPRIPRAVVGAGRGMRVGARVGGEKGVVEGAKAGWDAARGNVARRPVTVFGGVPNETADAMMRLGITRPGVGKVPGPAAPLNVLTDNAPVARIGDALEQGLGGGALTRAKVATVQGLDRTAADLAAREGRVLPTDRMARTARDHVLKPNSRNFTNRVAELKRTAFDGPEGQAIIQPQGLLQLHQQMQTLVAQYPRLRKGRYAAALGQLDNLAKTVAEKGGVPVFELKNMAQDIGELVNKMKTGTALKGKAGKAGAGRTLQETYDAFNTEVRTALGDTPAGEALDQMNALVRGRRGLDNPANERIVQRALRAKDTGQASLDLLVGKGPDVSGARAGRIADFRRTTNAKTWDNMRASRLNMVGRDAQGAFDPQRFATELADMSDAELRAWGFGVSQRKNLRELQKVSQAIGERGMPSVAGSTNNALYVMNRVSSAAMNGVTRGGGAAAAGTVVAAGTNNPLLGLGTAVGFQAVQTGLARAMASPTLGRWLTTTMRTVDRNPKALGSMLARLAAMRMTHKALAPDIDAILASFEEEQP